MAITGFGLWLATRATAPFGWLFALATIGVGTNYAPLAGHAATIRRPGRLTAELSGVDTTSELLRYTLLQLWVLVPFSKSITRAPWPDADRETGSNSDRSQHFAATWYEPL